MRLMVLFVLLVLAANVCATGADVGNTPKDLPKDAVPIENATIVNMGKRQERVSSQMSITRIIPKTAYPGEPFEVALIVKNLHNGPLETLTIDVKRPGHKYTNAPEAELMRYEGLNIYLLKWEETIEAGETKKYSYTISPSKPQTITFPVATVSDEHGNQFETAPARIDIICRSNGACDKGETYINCPDDCPTGSKDDACDGVKDGRVDPDCEADAEPDSIKPTTTTMADRVPIKKEEPGMCNALVLPILSLIFAVIFRKPIL